jgi:hypothetical protein
MTEVRTAGPWLTPEEERAWRAFRRMMVAVQSGLAFDLTSTGLSEPDYEVLSTLSEQPWQQPAACAVGEDGLVS